VFRYTATYKNPFTGSDTTEDIYCNLTAPELAKLELSLEGGFREHAANILKSGDGFRVLSLFETIVGAAYGRRTDDSTRFVKKREWVDEFITSLAWEDMFLWLTQDESGENANKFWAGLLSDRMKDQAEKIDVDGKKLTELSKEELVEQMQKLLSEKTPANEAS